MTSQNLALVSMALEGKLGRQDRLAILRQCEGLDDDALLLLYTANLKKPLVGLLFQWVLGFCGGGRFYKGDIVRGMLYIAAFIGVCALFVAGVVAAENGDESLLGASFILAGLCYIVLLADFYFIYKGIQRDNLHKITQALAFAKKKKANLE